MVDTETALSRLRDMLVISGELPTPDGLAHLTGMSLAEAREVFAFCLEMPSALLSLSRGTAAGKTRLFWLVTGRGLPSADHALFEHEAEVLRIAALMTPKQLQEWILIGRRMIGE